MATLQTSLPRAPAVREPGQHAHHIVASEAERAEPARLVLESVGMSINSAHNGIFLDPSQHGPIHNRTYYTAVNDALMGANTYNEVAARLNQISVGIRARTFPGTQPK